MEPVPAEPVAAQLAGMEHTDAQSVTSLLARVRAALVVAFPRDAPLWVRGEIQSISDHRSGHCYIDLVDPDTAGDGEPVVLKVNCWRSVWGPLKESLAKQGVTLEAGMMVTLRGRVEFYAPRGQVNFIAAELDVSALLGRLAQQRAALVAALGKEGLLTRNREVAVPAVPLRIGLVASPGTEGCRDFLGQLLGSGIGFQVLHVPTQVQGAAGTASVVAGLAGLAGAGCELVVVVRGGGAKADLALFDSEAVARAIATFPLPVWTGIGHSGDQSVADIVANRAFITPTQCGQEIVGRVGEWWASVADRAWSVSERARHVPAAAGQRDALARERLVAGVRRQLARHAERLGDRGARIGGQAPRLAEHAATSVMRRSARLGPLAVGVLGREADKVVSWRRLLAAYDVGRQLERGYTLTFDADGHIVRGVSGLIRGSVLVTRFADGTARSSVDTIDQAVAPSEAGPREEGA